ncbi:cobalamin B12-binding domain-containing protein [Desulfoscipio gibsoniae]|uniref:Methylmalonyl-CoA mutase family protein n=1 Tax=Desulfoscipio gibsoniae DSM 7213 TaxID=767817 RepID=R4KDK5_9FIRM|nr:cobalamin-dependent protein [Desulfoscipio gibsoniae]AGL00664.1 methylmalonyl-CoA mutase family protein [Desulfoscipio gibsoniae DSM 7213]
MKKYKKILLAKMGLDCHDTGIVTMAQLLRDAGFEVIYLGLHNTPEKVLRIAQDEDVSVIGISFLSGQHLVQMKKLMDLINQSQDKFIVLAGGVIPKEDIPKLLNLGVARVFGPGTMSSEIAGFIQGTL